MSKLIIFDCDGTLVDSEIIAAEVFPSVWSQMGVEMTVDYFLCNFVGTGNDADIVKKTVRERLFSAKADYYCSSAEELKDILKNLP